MSTKYFSSKTTRVKIKNKGAYLERGEVVIDEEGKTSHGNNKKLHAECVVVAIVGRLELDKHQVDSGNGARDEDNLHCCVVQ